MFSIIVPVLFTITMKTYNGSATKGQAASPDVSSDMCYRL